MSRYHVVLIGIDAYRGVQSLNGCVNDIDAMQKLLIERVGIPPEHIQRLASPRSDDVVRPISVPTLPATRENILAALSSLSSECVQADDKVFIAYSGHGTQLEIVGTDGGTFVREALLPADDKVFDAKAGRFLRRYLFDWELQTLLRQIAIRTSCITVILDCCNSAGATRDIVTLGTAERFAEIKERHELTRGTELPSAEVQQSLASGLASIDNCMVAAACRDDERARESATVNGTLHGELTRALLEQLDPLPDEMFASLRWADIWRAAETAVTARNPNQHPWLSSNPLRLFFGGPPVYGDAGYRIVKLPSGGFRIQAGTRAGITQGAQLAVYDSLPAYFPPMGTPEDLAARRGILEVTKADGSVAEAMLQGSVDKEVSAFLRGRMILAGETARMRVSISPPDKALCAALQMSKFFSVAEDGAPGEVSFVLRRDGQWALTDEVYGLGENPDEPTLPNVTRDDTQAAVALALHYFRYSAPLRFARACSDRPHALRIRLLDCSGLHEPLSGAKVQDPGLPELPRGHRAPYELHAGDFFDTEGTRFCIQVDNGADEHLFVTLFSCDSDGIVLRIADCVNIRAKGRQLIWHPNGLGEWFRAALSPLQRVGIERLVAIGTTDRNTNFDHLQVDTGFAEITRQDCLPEEVSKPLELWTASVLSLRLTR